MADFCKIETPPSSSTSKDSIDESISLLQTKKRSKLVSTNLRQISNQSNSIGIKADEVKIIFIEYICIYVKQNPPTVIRRHLSNVI